MSQHHDMTLFFNGSIFYNLFVFVQGWVLHFFISKIVFFILTNPRSMACDRKYISWPMLSPHHSRLVVTVISLCFENSVYLVNRIIGPSSKVQIVGRSLYFWKQHFLAHWMTSCKNIPWHSSLTLPRIKNKFLFSLTGTFWRTHFSAALTLWGMINKFPFPSVFKS